jgi:histone H3/H4
MHSLIQDQSDKQVSKSAADQLGKLLEKFAGDLAAEANAVAKEDGYQTVQGKHIRHALNS